MVSPPRLFIGWLFVGSLIVPATAQTTGNEFRPELGVYFQQGPTVRIEFVDFVSNDLTTNDRQVNYSFYVQTALKPVFRRELRDQPDVYRNKYLTNARWLSIPDRSNKWRFDFRKPWHSGSHFAILTSLATGDYRPQPRRIPIY